LFTFSARATISEKLILVLRIVNRRQMPPWSADPPFGHRGVRIIKLSF
jgi:hypothetical protein